MTYVSQPGEPAAEAFAPRWAARAADSPRRGWGGPPAAIHFAIGLPDPLLFPTTELLAATEVVLREQSATALQYGPAKGTPALLEVVREKLRRDEGLNLGPEQIMISSGSSQGISLVLRALCEPGDVVLCEAPTFLGTLGNFNRAEVRTVGLPVDEHGLDVRAAETILADLAAQGVRPKLLYTIPTFQNPMGVTMPLTRRVALLGLARRYDLLVLEDDAYRDLAFEGTPPPSLLSLDGEGRVIRVGTFSKILAAGMRLGWALGTGDAINRMIRARRRHLRPRRGVGAADRPLRGRLSPEARRGTGSIGPLHAARRQLDPTGGWLLHLDRPARAVALGGSAAPRPRGGRRFPARRRLLPAWLRRAERHPHGLQHADGGPGRGRHQAPGPPGRVLHLMIEQLPQSAGIAASRRLRVRLAGRDERETWNSFVAASPVGSLLQAWQWGEFKAGHGWRPLRVVLEAAEGRGEYLACAQVLLRYAAPHLPVAVAYIPRGPVFDPASGSPRLGAALWAGIHAAARRKGAIFCKAEPNLPASERLTRDLAAEGFRPAPRIQPSRTIILDLLPQRPEADLLAAMKPKTRYNIRLAARRGVTVRPGNGESDLAAFYALSSETSTRDEFAIHDLSYYRDALNVFTGSKPNEPAALLLLAYHPAEGDTPIAGLMAFAFGREAIYMYGASSDRGREHMPNHLLQWEAMRWARQRGCSSYDFWGIPDRPEEEAPEAGDNPNVRKGLWGVYRFKQGFGGREVEFTGSWDYVYRPLLYRAYGRLRGSSL
jgi:peptidoglycan pentaglycine glycine transferase (the first glycine)